MADGALDMDELIARLRTRAADPGRRVDVRPSAFDRRVQALDLGTLIEQLGSTRADLAGLLDGIRAGEVPARPAARAEAVGDEMADRPTTELPSPPPRQPSRQPRRDSGSRCRRTCAASTPKWPTAASDRVSA